MECRMKKVVLFFAAYLFCSTAVPALAAGWYLRGTLGFEWSLAADFSDADSTTVNPPARDVMAVKSAPPAISADSPSWRRQ